MEHGRFCPCPIPAAAEGPEPLDVERLARALHAGAVDGHLGGRDYCLDCESDAERIAAAYASQTSEGTE